MSKISTERRQVTAWLGDCPSPCLDGHPTGRTSHATRLPAPASIFASETHQLFRRIRRLPPAKGTRPSRRTRPIPAQKGRCPLAENTTRNGVVTRRRAGLSTRPRAETMSFASWQCACRGNSSHRLGEPEPKRPVARLATDSISRRLGGLPKPESAVHNCGSVMAATLRMGPVFRGAVAQLGERRVRNAKVRGSIPLGSTKFSTSVSPKGALLWGDAECFSASRARLSAPRPETRSCIDLASPNGRRGLETR